MEQLLCECVICRGWSERGSFTNFEPGALLVEAGWISAHQPVFMCRCCYLPNAVHSNMVRMRRNGEDERRLEYLLAIVLEWLSYTMREEAF